MSDSLKSYTQGLDTLQEAVPDNTEGSAVLAMLVGLIHVGDRHSVRGCIGVTGRHGVVLRGLVAFHEEAQVGEEGEEFRYCDVRALGADLQVISLAEEEVPLTEDLWVSIVEEGPAAVDELGAVHGLDTRLAVRRGLL